MRVRVVQAPQGSALDNSLDRAELQLAPNSTIPAAVDTNVVLQIMSMTKNGAPFGGFSDFTDIPGTEERLTRPTPSWCRPRVSTRSVSFGTNEAATLTLSGSR
jgi:hypothetical protein